MSQTQGNIYFLRFQSLIMRCNSKQSSEGSPHPEVETGHCTGYGLETRGWWDLLQCAEAGQAEEWPLAGRGKVTTIGTAASSGPGRLALSDLVMPWHTLHHQTQLFIPRNVMIYKIQKKNIYLTSVMSFILRHGLQLCSTFWDSSIIFSLLTFMVALQSLSSHIQVSSHSSSSSSKRIFWYQINNKLIRLTRG